MSKKLKLITSQQLDVRIEIGVYCDFCGEKDKQVVTSGFDDSPDTRKCEMQICFDCVTQLAKMLK